MRVALPTILPIALLTATLPAMALTHHHHHRINTSLRHQTVHHTAVHHESMDPGRATAIQEALIKQGYLTGDPSGTWDAQSVAAMQKLQADNGWQTKYTPDSRALIKLGLGGSNSLPGDIGTE